MSRYRLNWYEFGESESGDWLVSFPLGDIYSELVDQAFPRLSHIGWRPSTKGVVYTYIRNALPEEIKDLKELLDLLKYILVLRLNKNLRDHFTDELDQAFAIEFTYEDYETRTGVGALEYEAKYRKDRECAEKLAEHFDLRM